MKLLLLRCFSLTSFPFETDFCFSFILLLECYSVLCSAHCLYFGRSFCHDLCPFSRSILFVLFPFFVVVVFLWALPSFYILLTSLLLPLSFYLYISVRVFALFWMWILKNNFLPSWRDPLSSGKECLAMNLNHCWRPGSFLIRKIIHFL